MSIDTDTIKRMERLDKLKIKTANRYDWIYTEEGMDREYIIAWCEELKDELLKRLN